MISKRNDRKIYSVLKKISTVPEAKIQIGFSVLAIVILRYKMLLNIRYEQ